MLGRYVRFYLKSLAPYLVVGQEVEFTLNAKLLSREKEGEEKLFAIVSEEDSGCKMKFSIVFTEELKKYFEDLSNEN